MVPTGFRFNPTDEELIQILDQKAFGQQMTLHYIVERNVYEHEPQDLQWDPIVAVNNNERYYYCKKENDSREVAGRGWWKATSHVKKISVNEHLVGYKRPLTFHRFRDNSRDRNNAIKTNWIMHEYSLEPKATEWRLCKIKYKGKPSLQEEMENIRQDYTSRSDVGASSTMNMPLQTLQLNDMYEPNCCPNMHLEVINEGQQEQQQPQLSNDPCQVPIIFTGYNFGEQLEQPDATAQTFPSLWSWQN